MTCSSLPGTPSRLSGSNAIAVAGPVYDVAIKALNCRIASHKLFGGPAGRKRGIRMYIPWSALQELMNSTGAMEEREGGGLGGQGRWLVTKLQALLP